MKKFRIYQACTTLAAIATVAIAFGGRPEVRLGRDGRASAGPLAEARSTICWLG